MKKKLMFLLQFSIDDFKNKYAGSVLGMCWAFLQPILTILIYYFVFEIGFKSQPVLNFPFILWLIAGLVSWFFISEAISSATVCMVEYQYLVKKVLFNIKILPLAKVISALLVHLVLVLFTITIFILFGYYPDYFYLQIIYYIFATVMFVMGISYLTSAVYVFFKDILQIVSVLLQICFWMTPFVWDISIMPIGVQSIMKLNPIYYIVSGYRNTFVNKVWFFTEWKEGIYFWVVTLIIFAIGRHVFIKCKPHFADIL